MIDPIELRPRAKAAELKTIRILDRARKQVVIRLVDEDGAGIKLHEAPSNLPAQTPRWGYEAPVGDNTVTVKLIVSGGCWNNGGTTASGVDGATMNADEGHSEPVFTKIGKIIAGSQPGECLDCDGIVEFLFDSTDRIGVPGIYACQIERYVTGGYLVDAFPAYLFLEPNLRFPADAQGPLSIPEIRLAMGDTAVNEVSLLDTYEFTDTEVVYAMRSVVDHWNETPPPVRTYTYNNFPFRYWWIHATIAALLEIAVKRYARNQLNYNAGGVQIDDQNKAKEYTAIAQTMKQEYMDWFVRTKVGQNMSRAWSSIPLGGRARGY